MQFKKGLTTNVFASVDESGGAEDQSARLFVFAFLDDNDGTRVVVDAWAARVWRRRCRRVKVESGMAEGDVRIVGWNEAAVVHRPPTPEPRDFRCRDAAHATRQRRVLSRRRFHVHVVRFGAIGPVILARLKWSCWTGD